MTHKNTKHNNGTNQFWRGCIFSILFPQFILIFLARSSILKYCWWAVLALKDFTSPLNSQFHFSESPKTPNKPEKKIPNKTLLNVYMKIPIYVAFKCITRCYIYSLNICLLNACFCPAAQKIKQSSLATHRKDIQMKATQT